MKGRKAKWKVELSKQRQNYAIHRQNNSEYTYQSINSHGARTSGKEEKKLKGSKGKWKVEGRFK